MKENRKSPKCQYNSTDAYSKRIIKEIIILIDIKCRSKYQIIMDNGLDFSDQEINYFKLSILAYYIK